MSFPIGEAFANVRTGTARSGLLAVVILVVVLVAILFDTVSVVLISSKAESFREAGGAVRVLVARDGVDVDACERLGRIAGVVASGAVQEQAPVVMDAMPGLKVPHYALSPGAADLLGIDVVDRAGFYLPTSLAEQWGMHTGSLIETDSGRGELLGTFEFDETDGRDPRLANAFVDLAVMKMASECWMETPPGAGSSYDDLLRTAVAPDAVTTADIQISAFNPAVHVGADGYREFQERPSKYGLLAVVVVAAIVAAGATARRRLEMSSNLHAGATHIDLVMVTLFESLITVFVVGMAAFAVVAWIVRLLLPAATDQLLPAYVSSIVVAVLGAVLGGIAPIAFLSESRLFRSFKRRI
ncbi:hypothetical protein [Microbacterium sp. T32]|uniref:hypothetical protein n=1 Tax=Microbacterium sp. T32 TaxID=1776083 RepID=UPI001E5B3A73|nr:hypothetical protein [Microbacterium sp. T32]